MSRIDDIPAEYRHTIGGKLDQLEAQHDVEILFAVESGSRAWGFPSPDSDFDVRFVYAHRTAWYLAIDPRRDVLEQPIDGLLDINGWDLRKALTLMLKPNPVLLEWLSSPIRYRWNDKVSEPLVALSYRIAHETACRYHYLHLAEGQFSRDIFGIESVKLKKYFYALRPAMALRWVRLQPNVIPPMHFPTLMAGCDIGVALSREIGELMEMKATTREIGNGPRRPALDGFITNEIELAKQAGVSPVGTSPATLDEANSLFRDTLAKLGR